MAKIIVLALIISALWMQTGFGIKCYIQQCEKSYGDWRCNFANKAAKDGDIREDKVGCYEKHMKIEGELYEHLRCTMSENPPKDKPNDGCFTEKIKNEEMDAEVTHCYCFKDLCNNKFSFPEGTKFSDDPVPEKP